MLCFATDYPHWQSERAADAHPAASRAARRCSAILARQRAPAVSASEVSAMAGEAGPISRSADRLRRAQRAAVRRRPAPVHAGGLAVAARLADLPPDARFATSARTSATAPTSAPSIPRPTPRAVPGRRVAAGRRCAGLRPGVHPGTAARRLERRLRGAEPAARNRRDAQPRARRGDGAGRQRLARRPVARPRSATAGVDRRPLRGCRPPLPPRSTGWRATRASCRCWCCRG